MGGLGWILPFSFINGIVAVSILSRAGSEGGEGYRKLTSPIDILKNLDTVSPATNKWSSEFQPLKRVSALFENKFPESTLPPPPARALPPGSSKGVPLPGKAPLQEGAASVPLVSRVPLPPGFLTVPEITSGPSASKPRSQTPPLDTHAAEGTSDLTEKEEDLQEAREVFADENISLEIEPSGGQVERAAFGVSFGTRLGTPLATSRQLRPPRARRPRRGPQRPRGPARRPTAVPTRQRPPRHPDISVIPLQPLEAEDNTDNLLSLRFPPFTNDFPPFAAPPPTPSALRGEPNGTPPTPFPREPPSPFIASFATSTPFPVASTLSVAPPPPPPPESFPGALPPPPESFPGALSPPPESFPGALSPPPESFPGALPPPSSSFQVVPPPPPETFLGAPPKPAGEDLFPPQAPPERRPRFPAPPPRPRPDKGPRRQRKPGSARQPKGAEVPVEGSRQLKKEAKRLRGTAPIGHLGRRNRPPTSSFSSVWAALQHVFQSPRG
ncbi:formin-like protein 5 [Penaeus chinensis]|uniref:formin-like protein 5 n=1 Tax=Penaeus chinensis TaxID=139456 RepID=UPI001FB7AC31|nr:formin-like protein 5 [Penaeus chinensis]